MKLTISKLRNNSIYIFRYLFAVIVVMFHCRGFSEISQSLNYVLAQIPARIAVPFFFTIGGYFFCIKLASSEKDAVRNYFKKEWIVYTAWSLLYFALILFALRDEVFLWKDYLSQCIRNYFIFGSYYHLWYIPVMFFSAGLFYIAYRWGMIPFLCSCAGILYIIGCIGTAYYNIFVNFPVIGELLKWKYFVQFTRFLCRGVPFFTMGANIYLQKSKHLARFFYEHKSGKRLLWICSYVVFGLFIVEQYVICHFKLMESPIDTFMLLPFVGMLLIILLKHPRTSAQKIGQICGLCSSFVYFSHPAIILFLQKFFEKLKMSYVLSPTMLFIFTVIIGTIVGIILPTNATVMQFNKRKNRFLDS